jgi:hypothetical protein
MEIVDNVFDPFMSGNISIANPYDLIEDEFSLIGDGKDELFIKFKPVEVNGYPDTGFEHTFVVIDEPSDTVNPLVRSENIKNFNIVSKYSVAFTNNVPHGRSYKGYIGDIIKTLFEELNIPTGQWESGEKLEFEYIPPITFRYIDVLRYFMRIFCAKENLTYVKAFLNYNSETRNYELIKLSDIFSQNKSLTIESFPVGDLISNVGYDNPSNPLEISTVPTGEYIGQIKNISYFTPMYVWNSDFFTNSIVSGYDKISGHHKMVSIKLSDMIGYWTQAFVTPFTNKGGNVLPFMFPSGKNNKIYKLPYPITLSTKIIQAEIMTNLTFYNLNLSFTNIGNTTRQSSRFIQIVSPKKNIKYPKSDEKLLGTWFVTEIHHVFNGDSYTNDIFAVKTYVGKSSK